MNTASAATASSDAPETIAQDPTTPAETLRELYESHHAHYDYKTRKTVEDNAAVLSAIVQNPNAPLDLLSTLMSDYAPAFCQNPIAPLVVLEKPDFLTTLDTKAQLALLMCADAPASLVQLLASSGSGGPKNDGVVAAEARQHIALAGELPAEQWQTVLETICRTYCQTTPSPDEKQFHADYAELGLLPASWPEAEASLPKANDSQLSAALIGNPWADKGAKALARAFAPEISPALLKTLAQVQDGFIHSALAMYEPTPAEILKEIANSENNAANRLRLLAARHPNADAALLADFAGDKNPVLRRLARKHKNAPANAFELGRQTAARARTATPLWYLVSGLYDKLPLEEIRSRTVSPFWMQRLSVVFALTSGLTRLSDERRDMLLYLTSDSSRIVRAAAQACFADPEFRFSFNSPING